MSSELMQENKNTVWRFWQELNQTGATQVADVVRRYVHTDSVWHGPHPINDLEGAEAMISGFWQPLLTSFPNLKRQCDIFIGGHKHWVGAIGYFSGTFSRDWLGIPATGRETHIRFGEFCAVHNGKIVLTYIIPDVLDVMRQAGYQLVPPSLGEEGLVPGPRTGDGVLLTPHKEAEGAKTLALAKTMCQALNTPRCEQYWDPEGMLWYGPSGIGTTRGFKEFDDLHQQPFYHGIPSYGWIFGGLHVAEVGEGNYAGWVGWPSIRAIHTGEYLGCAPTGKLLDWRLMDFYRREGDRIMENWVPIDMIYLFLQMGLDVFEEVKKQSQSL